MIILEVFGVAQGPGGRVEGFGVAQEAFWGPGRAREHPGGVQESFWRI